MLWQFCFIFLILSFILGTVVENFWNIPTRSTRNQSYDLRGDPYIIPPAYYPWNNSTISQPAFWYY